MLPGELVALIAGYLDPCSLNAFRVTCKRVNEVVVYTEVDKKVYSKDMDRCVRHGKTELVKRHFDAYPDDPLIHHCIRWSYYCALVDNHDMARVFVSHGAVCPHAVFYAIQGRAYKTLDVLVEYGYTINDDVFMESLVKNDIELIRTLIAHGANVNARIGYALRLACEIPLRFSIIHLLLDNGADPKFIDFAALRLLHLNKYNDDESREVASITRRLVHLGADINDYSDTLYRSCRRKNQVLVRVLLECGADVARDMGPLDSTNIERMLLIVSQVDKETGRIDKEKRIIALREAFGEISY